jgi:hypothetical protein
MFKRRRNIILIFVLNLLLLILMVINRQVDRLESAYSGGSCPFNGDYECSGGDLYYCENHAWMYIHHCQLGCDLVSNPSTQCLPDQSTPYCENDCSTTCSDAGCSGSDCRKVYCWDNEAQRNGEPGFPPTRYFDCLAVPTCLTCHPQWDRCCTPSDPGCVGLNCSINYPDKPYAYIDSCSRLSCRDWVCGNPTPINTVPPGNPSNTPPPPPNTPTRVPTPTGVHTNGCQLISINDNSARYQTITANVPVTVNVKYNGTSNLNSPPVMLEYFASWPSGGTINPPLPTVAPLATSNGVTYYAVAQSLANGFLAQNSVTLPVGKYGVFCHVDGEAKCSGNPYCTINGEPGTTDPCVGWADCGSNDHIILTVVAAPTPSGGVIPTPTGPVCTPVCTNFENIYINSCTPQSAWSASPHSLCYSASTIVSVHSSDGNLNGCADRVQYYSPPDPNTLCANVPDSAFGPNDDTNTYPLGLMSYNLTPGYGNRKICGRLISGFKTYAKCGGLIEIVTPTATGTPTPTPYVQARARTYASAVSSCPLIGGSYQDTTYNLHGVGFTYDQTENSVGSTYAKWSPVDYTKTYRIEPTPPINSNIIACVSSDGGATWSKNSQYTINSDVTTWEIGYYPPSPWFESQGGDVYASAQITSLMPLVMGPPRQYFSMNGSGLFPGFVKYGNGFDAYLGTGAPYGFEDATNTLSTKQWLVNTSFADKDFYSDLTKSIGGVPDDDTFTPALGVLSDGDLNINNCPNNICFISGNIVTNNVNPIVLVNNEKYIVVIKKNGSGQASLNIRNEIRLTAGTNAFIGFIVDGDITVDSGVGTMTYNSTTPQINGLFATSGDFNVPSTGSPGERKLIASGIYLANSFSIKRDLGAASSTTPGVLFIHNPRLLFDMPIVLWKTVVNQAEVVPEWNPTPTP